MFQPYSIDRMATTLLIPCTVMDGTSEPVRSYSRASTIPSTVIGRKCTICWCRSEEHTSELQSPCNLVCRLLLEKKKNIETRGRYQQHEDPPEKYWREQSV